MSGPADKMVAVVGPSLWEADDAMNALARDLAAVGGLATKIFNEHREDKRHLGLRDMTAAGHIAGLAVVNFSHDFHERLEPDDSVRMAARHVAKAGLPIFVAVEEPAANLGLEDLSQAEIIPLGDPGDINIGVITDRLLSIGVT